MENHNRGSGLCELKKFYRARFFLRHRAIARRDRAIQYAAAVVMNLDASGILDAPPS